MQDFVGVKDVIKPARLAQLSERRNGPGLIYLASHVGEGWIVRSAPYPTCDTRSHEYLSRRIRCSVIGTVPGRASGVTPRCEAPGTM